MTSKFGQKSVMLNKRPGALPPILSSSNNFSRNYNSTVNLGGNARGKTVENSNFRINLLGNRRSQQNLRL